MKTSRAFAVALGILLIAPISRAQMPTAEVQELLGQVGHAYSQIKTFAALIETSQQLGPIQQTTKTVLTLRKPDRLNAYITNGMLVRRIVSDGTKAYTDSSLNQATYTEQPVNGMPDMIQALARAGGTGAGLLPILLAQPEDMPRIIPVAVAKVTREPDETLDGVVCDVILAQVGEGDRGARIGMAFGKEDRFLRRVTLGSAAQPKPQVIETYSRVTSSPKFDDSIFTFTPVPGAVAVAPPKEPERFDARIKVGADPLPITGKDMEGKEISLDQFKGKVVLVDFWAIWCGPCIAELPNVVAAYDKYKDQGFDVLGISLDEANAEAKLKIFLAENKMSWRQVYDGGQWSAANAVAWGVQAIPFTVLIGKDGKIAAVNLRGDALGSAIEEALKK